MQLSFCSPSLGHSFFREEGFPPSEILMPMGPHCHCCHCHCLTSRISWGPGHWGIGKRTKPIRFPWHSLSIKRCFLVPLVKSERHLLEFSLSVSWRPFWVSGCLKSRPGDSGGVKKQNRKFTAEPVVVWILVFLPSPPATIYFPESSNSCSMCSI